MRPDATPFSPTLDLEPGVTLLEASAGTGKTYSITSLYLRLVAENGLGVDEILVVTYTVAATAELKNRIRARLRDAADALRRTLARQATPEDFPDEVLRRLASASNPEREARLGNLRTALARLDDAAISTIHGFCQRMLQRHSVETRADLDAEVAEDDQALLDEVTDDAYVSALNTLNPAVAGALRRQEFRAMLGGILAEMRNHPDATLAPPVDPEPPEPDPRPWNEAVGRLCEAWRQGGEEAKSLLTEAMAEGRLNLSSFKPNTVAEGADILDLWAESPPEAFSAIQDPLKYFRKSYLAEKCRRGKTPPSHPLFDLVDTLSETADRLQQDLAAFRLGLAHRLLRDLRQRFQARKRQERVWSFQDLVVLLRDGLRDERHGPALARAIRGQFRAALIDEFQDTDGVQWEIFDRVFRSPDHYLFLIGDPKQAIYSFRGADIHAYLAARRRADRQYTLLQNWRSDGRWVQGLNRLYGRAVRPFLDPDIPYVPVRVPDQHADDRLRYPAGRHAPIVVRFVRRSDFGVEGTQALAKTDLTSLLPECVAGDISRLLAEGAEVQEAEDFRPLDPRDVAVLVRTHDQAWAVQRALRRVGIPSVLHSEASVFESEAATDLALALGAVVDPDDRTAVRSALATSLFGQTVPEVVALEEQPEAWSRWVEDLRRWGAAWRERGFSPMFRAMLHERQVLPRLLTLQGGERLVTDLLHLAEQVQGVESRERLAPEALLTWLLRERSQPSLSSEARQIRLESDEDAVVVVTMHHAKGLEYPVVFCPYLWDGRLFRQSSAALRFHAEDGIRVCASGVSPPEDWDRARTAAQQEVFAENLRMAYVALTRARHQTFVYWAAAKEHETSALAWLLFGPESPEDLGSHQARSGALDDEAMLRELSALAEASGGTLAVEPVNPSRLPQAYRPPTREALHEVAAARFHRPEFDRTWQWTSFTRMVADRGGEEPGDDEAWTAARAEEREGDTLLAGFPRGRIAGRCLHAAFERLDFACEDPGPVVRDALIEYGLDAGALTSSLCDAVRVTLDTPLPAPGGPVRLRDVALADRLNEVSFLVPLAGGIEARDAAVTVQDLAHAFERHGGRLGPRCAAALRDLPTSAVRGFLAGQMDLVFRVGSRWFLVDYKSNDLGPARSDYSPERLDDEMIASYYFLQYHLYATALHRYACVRMPGFEWDRDFGGVFYLFVRGLDRTGRTGVFWDRPSGALVQALSDLFGGTA